MNNRIAKILADQAKGWALDNKCCRNTRKKNKRQRSKAVRAHRAELE